jgi:hypothetical protein
MIFCIDHADAAEEIVDIIVQSLLIPATPVFPTKLARLYLVSDVLHNSSTSVPNAWKFRSAFEKHLPSIFTHLGVVWKSIAARLRAEQMRKAIFAVVSVWEKWIVFNRDFTDDLKSRFQAAAQKVAEEEKREEQLRRGLQAQMELKTGVFSFEDDDLDGVPLTKPIAAGGDSRKTTQGDDDEYDDDLDGMPMVRSSDTGSQKNPPIPAKPPTNVTSSLHKPSVPFTPITKVTSSFSTKPAASFKSEGFKPAAIPMKEVNSTASKLELKPTTKKQPIQTAKEFEVDDEDIF